MKRPLVGSFLLLLAACSSAPSTSADPSIEADVARAEQADARRRDMVKVLIELDQAIRSYDVALRGEGTNKADQQLEKIERFVRDVVLDNTPRQRPGAAVGRDPTWVAGENYRQLRAIATDTTNPWQQGIALTALGFSGRDEVMETLIAGVQLPNPDTVDHAVFGLAVLRHRRTPPGPIAAVVLRHEHPEAGRINAAWALYRLHQVSERQQDFVEQWLRILADKEQPDGVHVSAVRGIGLSRDVQYAALVLPFLKSNTPLLRCAATVALARMNAQQHWQDVLALLDPAETNDNVRLHARKALAGLAGGVDLGYDVAAWRKQFDRGKAASQ